MTTLLDTAVQAARVAGAIIRAGWGQPHTVQLKGVINPVTEIDHAADAAILEILRAATPDYGFLTEETGVIPGRADARWVIDPLDGTVNYAHHFPYFATSIALERDGRSELGVIYDPILDQLFSAERGRGAFLNGNRIAPSEVPDLAGSLIATGFPYDVWESGGTIAELGRLVRCIQTPRINGAAVLDLCYVACGRMEAYWDTGLSPWDVAAGSLIVEEAGGRVSFFGDPAQYDQMMLIASNARIHDALAAVVAPRQP